MHESTSLPVLTLLFLLPFLARSQVEVRASSVVSAGVVRLEASGTCAPSWIPTFGGLPGVNGFINAVAVFDDGSGSGPALYVAGAFFEAGSTPIAYIAEWDGASWSSVGGGVNNQVYALAVYDDGSGGGSALYAAGEFAVAGGSAANRIARWNGTAWSELGSGLNDVVRALTVYDDGGGPALYAAGKFTTAGGLPASRIAKWNGSAWSSLGLGVNGPAIALAVHDDASGGGPALYVGGNFSSAGGAPAENIAQWDGASWSPLGSGMTSLVYALTSFDDGSGAGSALYAGGTFLTAGGHAANKVAKWNGTSWAPLGSGIGGSGFVLELGAFDDGSGGGPALYVGGQFLMAGGSTAANIAKWDGVSWSTVGSGLSDGSYAFVVFDDGSGGGDRLYVGGDFTYAGLVLTRGIASWDGTSWAPVAGAAVDGIVRSLSVFDDRGGEGPELYASGDFTQIGEVPASRVAKWDGTSWSALGSGMSGGEETFVAALAVFDDGAGPELYAGGSFSEADGELASNIARWNGSSWSRLAGGTTRAVRALAVFDDGTGAGPALYVGGDFAQAGGLLVNRIAKWNGTAWSPLGSGLSGANPYVHALAAYDDGTGAGPALYAGGGFTMAGAISTLHVAKWTGALWSSVGNGVNGPIVPTFVRALTVHDDGSGSGPALYAAGNFTNASGVGTHRVAKWDGISWSSLGSGLSGTSEPDVYALRAYDDGTGAGPALYAGGTFSLAGGAATGNVARWDGSAWSALGTGVGSNFFPATVHALAVFDDGSDVGSALIVGGQFTYSQAGDANLARWGGCASAELGLAFCFGDGSGTPCPCSNPGGAGEGCANSTGAGALLAAGGSTSVLADDLWFLAHQLPPNEASLLFAGTSALNGGNGFLFGDGLRCAGGTVRRLGVRFSSSGGEAYWGPGLSVAGNWAAGDTRRFQAWYRDPTGGPCASGHNLSSAYEIVLTP